jgi:5-formyltetrahydrofolate cyclo-ligase
MTKKELRGLYLKKRTALSVQEKDKLEDLILIRFQSAGIDVPDMTMSYICSEANNEYDPVLVERFSRFLNPFLNIAYPVIGPADSMEAVVPGKDEKFKRNKFGIEEPEDGSIIDPLNIDMILVPLLAFDQKGYRVGYGKGYYDRFLRNCREDVLKIGFSFFSAEEVISDINEFDVPLDLCITPGSVYYFIKK